MAPTGPRALEPESEREREPEPVGPHIGSIKCGRQYLHEISIRRKLANSSVDPNREDTARLQGVQLIHDVRNYLGLPVTTFTAACGYYHRFRLKFPGNEYQWADAALACLFVACKSEDTIKKSRDILCANHNLKNPDNPTTPDDKIFDQGSKMMIGLERHVIETMRFDFRVRNPHKMLAKIVKALLGSGREASEFFVEAYKAGIDMYKTFAPLKHTTFTCAFMIAQLTSMVTGRAEDMFMQADPADFFTKEEWVAEAMLDVLDLYTDHTRSTLLGRELDPKVFIDAKIRVNKKCEAARIPRYQHFCAECEREKAPPSPSSIGSDTPDPTSPAGAAPGGSFNKRVAKSQDKTFRFLFDANEARQEKATYERYMKDEYEEWEEEVEETIPERADLGPEPRPPREPRGARGGRGRGRGRGGHDGGWRGRGDRRRGSRGGFYN
ncbi:cyclin-like protein [Xylariaceae sp. FL0255]|nr:cyclin-like protein [Xylariaceae sp. FL0255]